MKLKEIHDAYCEKQRIEQDERRNIKIQNTVKALELKVNQEKEIVERMKPLFLQKFEDEIQIIQDAGIRVRYVADWYESNTLYIELITDGCYVNFYYTTLGCFYLDDGYTRVIETKEHLLSTIYKHFFD